MSKRNSDVAHEWANGRDIRTGRNNVFAEDGTIFSYGRHFPVARFYGNDRGVVLFTSHDYSNSTARHKSYVRRAIPSRVKVFVVDKVCGAGGGDLTKPQHRENLKAMISAIASQVARAGAPRLRAETRADALSYAEGLRITANEYRAQFKLGGKPLASIGVAVDRVREIERAAATARRLWGKRTEEKRMVSALAAADRLREWVAGGNNATFFGYDLPVAFRLKAGTRGRVVQSSKGAEFTATAARAAYPRLCELRAELSGDCQYVPAIGVPADDVLTISGFRTEAVDCDGVTVGCHRVTWQAVEELAALLGVGEGVQSE